ncbi:hypothetical protein XPA_003754 [Xanthoria parietina]
MMSSIDDGFVPPGSTDVTAAPSTTFLTLTSGYYQAVNTGQGSSEEQPSVANSTRPGTTKTRTKTGTKTSSSTFQSATFSYTTGTSGSGPSDIPPSGSSETISTGFPIGAKIGTPLAIATILAIFIWWRWPKRWRKTHHKRPNSSGSAPDSKSSVIEGKEK